jgi:type I restriction enzyme S subunit
LFPKLRFKEFDDDWSPYVLKDFVSFRKGKGISKADISENGINECIRYGELYTTYGQVIDHIHSKTNVSKSECILSKAGDVIIPASGETQIDIATASCVLHDDIILSGDLNILSHEENGSWLAYYLSSAKKLEIAQLAQGNSVVHLYSSQLKDLKINKPSKEEQTKIASFLSNVDEKISQLTQKLELLSQYKQGMMQKLFSQQIRFRADDGSEFGEWETTTLGQTGKFIGGGTPSKENSEFWEGSIPWISSSDLTEESIFKINITRFISQNALNQSATKLVPANSILIVSRVGVGKVAITPNEICTSQDFTSLTLHKGSSIFFAYLIKSLTPVFTRNESRNLYKRLY